MTTQRAAPETRAAHEADRLTAIDVSGWRGRMHPELALVIGDESDPLEAFRRQGELIHEREMAGTWRLESSLGVLFVKHMHDGRDCPDSTWHRRLRWRLRPSRAARTLRMHLMMSRSGLSVPEVLLAARRRRGLRVEDLLVTRTVKGVPVTEALRPCESRSEQQLLLAGLGGAIAHLHRERFDHGHLLLGHLFLDPEEQLWSFIDNDENHRWWFGVPDSRRRRNLVQVIRHLVIEHPYAMTRALLDGYFEAIGWESRRRRRLQAGVLRRCRERIRSRGRRAARR
ncbi:MAG: lipopolysaccharide kinase InaA family protein [Planctomycetota bacterium]|jgi:hypothetical protein